MNLYNGTNDAEMARHIKSGAAGVVEVPSATYNGYDRDFYSANPNGIYLTEKDYAMEIGMMTTYQIYENLRLLVEANYVCCAWTSPRMCGEDTAMPKASGSGPTAWRTAGT